jgi:predicted HicB family RNase H-like nuclease
MILIHDGYIAQVSYVEGDDFMHGATVNTRAVLHFAGKTVAELKQAFADTIADYRDFCASKGVTPEKPYSGNLSLRLSPELHAKIAIEAMKAGESLNQFIAGKLEEAV